MDHRRTARGGPVRATASLVLALLLSLAAIPPGGAADPPAEALPAPTASAHPPLLLDLGAALHLALERQPRIAMQRASLAAAQDGQWALANLKIPDALFPQLPYRRQQACLGVTAAVAGLQGAEHQVVYAVTRTYFTVLYAREQERVARQVVERLRTIYESAQQMLDAGSPGVTSGDVRRTLVYLRLAEAKRVQATEGMKRALAALEEAVGVGPEVCMTMAEAPLPVPEARPCRGEVVALALARRPELIEANVFAQVVCLEVDAQDTSIHKRLETFASGSDIHAHAVPPEIHDTEYQPGATPPEMPDSVAGSKCDRVQHVRDLYARAAAGIEQTRNLIVLDADNAFLRWEEASQQVALAKEAADAGDKFAADLDRDFRARLKVKIGDVVDAWVLASQTHSQYNEYLYHLILALADLERATAGGFCAGLTAPAAPQAQPAAEKGGEDKGKGKDKDKLFDR